MNQAWIEKLMERPLMSRVWSMPSKWTFTMGPVQDLFDRYEVGPSSPPRWIDPMAGMASPAHPENQNDLNPESPALSHVPALDFLKSQETGSAGGVLWDPPYSIHQVKVAYDSFGLSVKDNITGGFPQEKDELARIIPGGGLAISFGWHTVGMGLKRGFKPIEYMIISHGGNRNDTLVTVEVKL